MKTFSLSTSLPNINYIIDHVQDTTSPDPVAERLRDLGFVSGETVRIIATGPFGGNPIAVQIGSTRFALRKSEAARVILRPFEENL